MWKDGIGIIFQKLTIKVFMVVLEDIVNNVDFMKRDTTLNK